MAKAKANFRTATKTVTEEVRDGITLTLTQDEAETLRLVVGNIGGPSTTRRGHTSAIHNALVAAGITVPRENARYEGSIRFLESGVRPFDYFAATTSSRPIF